MRRYGRSRELSTFFGLIGDEAGRTPEPAAASIAGRAIRKFIGYLLCVVGLGEGCEHPGPVWSSIPVDPLVIRLLAALRLADIKCIAAATQVPFKKPSRTWKARQAALAPRVELMTSYFHEVMLSAIREEVR